MTRRSRIAISLLVAVAVPAVRAQSQLFTPQNTERLRRGLQAVYGLEHDRAIAEYQALIREHPDDPLGYAFLAKTYWLKELVSKQELSIDRFASSDFFSETPRYTPEVDETAEELFRTTSETAKEKARAQLARNPNDARALFLLGMIYQNIASFEASLKRAWWASFRAGSKSHRYHKELLQQTPDFYDAYLTTGVFNYVTGSLGWQTRWLALLLGHPGNKERGLEQLQQAAAKSELFGDDARVILALVYTREKRYQAAFDELAALHKRYPKNYLVDLDMGGIALLMNRDDQALKIYSNILHKVEAKQDLYERLEPAAVYNRLGTAYRSSGDLRAAVEQHQRALRQPKIEEHTRVVALLELGKSYDLLGERERALGSYRSVLTLPDFADSLSEARLLIAMPYRRSRER